MEELNKVAERDGLEWGLHFAKEQVARLAAAAMRIGFLLRGGATVGPVHHKRGVVFGKAMVEAHKLESRHAIYPRVIVSRKLYSQAKPVPRSHVLLKDDDGITHLNYFTSMVLRSGEVEASRGEWLDRARRTVEENVAKF